MGPILYLIASGPFDDKEFLQRVERALRGGVDWVQLRVKDKGKASRLLLPLKDMTEKFAVKLIVNDFVDLAIKADGVHLGKDDMDPALARKELKGKILGVSCYNQLDRALQAEKTGADYVAFGSLFPSPTKPESVRVEFSILKRAKEILKTKICVIGGINRTNIAEVLKLKPDIIAISSAIFVADDPEREAAFFKERLSFEGKGNMI